MFKFAVEQAEVHSFINNNNNHLLNPLNRSFLFTNNPFLLFHSFVLQLNSPIFVCLLYFDPLWGQRVGPTCQGLRADKRSQIKFGLKKMLIKTNSCNQSE